MNHLGQLKVLDDDNIFLPLQERRVHDQVCMWVWSGGKGEREGETDSDIQGKAEKKMAREKERDSVLARRGTEYIGCVCPYVMILVCCRLIVIVSFCLSRWAVIAKTYLRRNSYLIFFPFLFLSIEKGGWRGREGKLGYITPTPADTYVNAYRKWFDGVTPPPHAPHAVDSLRGVPLNKEVCACVCMCVCVCVCLCVCVRGKYMYIYTPRVCVCMCGKYIHIYTLPHMHSTGTQQCYMWHVSCICDMHRWYVTWRIRTWHYASRC